MAWTVPCVLLSLMLQMILMTSCLPRNPIVIKSRKSMAPSKPTPQFMVDLYNNYSKSGIKPVPEIIRCFEGTGSQLNLGLVSAATRQISHKFTFNITGIQRNERVKRVDIRMCATLPDNHTSLEIEIFQFISLGKQNLIGSRTIHGRYSDWVVINLNRRYRRWLQRNRGDLSNYQLQVKLRSLSLNKLQIGRLEGREKAPLLVVFSEKPEKSQTNDQVKQVSASPSALFTEGGTKHDAALSQQRQEICRRKPMYIDFNSIGWDSWIIAPLGYQAYKCAGSCTVNQTNYHTIVQALAHQMGSNTSAPCCVPNKLSPITLMYAYDKAIVLLSRYENMVVESCACL